jgi:plastocyanin
LTFIARRRAIKTTKEVKMSKEKVNGTHEIRVSIKRGEEVVCNPPAPIVYPGDTVTWITVRRGLGLAIQFGWDSPFKETTYVSGEDGSITAIVEKYAPFGLHKYFVAVYDGATIRTADPDIIIRPRP